VTNTVRTQRRSPRSDQKRTRAFDSVAECWEEKKGAPHMEANHRALGSVMQRARSRKYGNIPFTQMPHRGRLGQERASRKTSVKLCVAIQLSCTPVPSKAISLIFALQRKGHTACLANQRWMQASWNKWPQAS